MEVCRPLLNYSKKELLEECKNNSIPYSIDVTNLQPICERNKVRLNLEKIAEEEIEQLIVQKMMDNQKLDEEMANISHLLALNEWSIDELKSLSEIERIRLLYEIISSRIPNLVKSLTRKRIDDYLNQLFAEKSNNNILINNDYYICKTYGKFKVICRKNKVTYSYMLECPGRMETPYFSFDIPRDTSFLKIYPESYPLTIRNARPDDYVTFGNVRKKVNRIMIDEKIPLDKRDLYPVVVDKDGRVVYVPLYN